MQADFLEDVCHGKSGGRMVVSDMAKQLRHFIRIMPEIAPLQKASSQQL